MAMTYLISNVLHLTGWRLWAFRMVLWLLGFVAFGLIYWFAKRRSEVRATEDRDDELEATLATAKAKLAASPATAKTSLNKLPLVIVLGPEGSTKTSVVVNSGLNPDLLAGAVFHGDRVAPTGCVNFWYSNGTVFLEAGGAFNSEPSRWQQLLRYVRPQTLGAVFSGRPQSPRAALVCLSCEELLRPDASTAVPTVAQELRATLVEMAHSFGTQLPVYVLFTKVDRIPYFAEYVANLTREEVQEVLGATLRWPTGAAAGSPEKEYQRVNDAFQRLFAGMAESRLLLLPREADQGRRSCTYEFPREFRKLAPLATQFLIDLCRPSQLRISPVLRGFYFAGVRAVVVSEAAPEVARQATPDEARIAATQVFDVKRRQAAADAAASPLSRKIPQWLFLHRLFRDVILRDRMAMGVTQTGSHMTLRRRVVMAGAVACSLLLGSCFTVSYFGNKSLERRAEAAAHRLARVPELEPELLDMQGLLAMDELRASVETLAEWELHGPPLRLRWGLYRGSALYPLLGGLYLTRFENLMLRPAREALLDSLRRLPDTPEERSEYQPNYELLRAYLMTTGDCRIDSAFLAPVLWDRWLEDRMADAERDDIARRQFDFYAGKLCLGDEHPCVADAEQRTVRRARNFLLQYSGPDRNYQLMLSNASSANPSVRFTDPAGAVQGGYEVPGAFTVAGWATVQNYLDNLDQLALGEDCVVGSARSEGVDIAALEESLRTRYVADYVSHWRAFIERASVPAFGTESSAAAKLEVLGDRQSPLLQLLHMAALNTVVDSVSVAPAFQPVHLVMPPVETETLYGESNAQYVDALQELLSSVQAVAQAQRGSRDSQVGAAIESAQKVERTVRRLALGFNAGSAEPGANAVQALLMQPADRAARSVRGAPVRDLNAAARAFCNDYASVTRKYPFTSNASSEASLDEVSRIFHPETGALRRFYDSTLQDIIERQGPVYAARQGGYPRPSSQFLRFFNAASSVSEALWTAGEDDPGFVFGFRAQTTDAVPTVRLAVDGVAADFTRTRISTVPIRWAGPRARSAELVGTIRGRSESLLSYTGPWALFKLFGRAGWEDAGSQQSIRWTLDVRGEGFTIEGQVNFSGRPNVLRPDFLRAARDCAGQITG
ncbi:MAG TPA: ImcF-related family protein [Gemmatimonadota bacterium]|nr:ImcF-related family protein [Gemmatimonadota bacterium]